MENATVVSRSPAGVREVIGLSFDYFISLVGDDLLRKYLDEGDQAAYKRLLIEA